MPMLEEVYFSRGFDLMQIHGISVDLSHLRVLNLSKIRILNDRLPCDAFKKGTSPITSLAIEGFEDSSDTLHRLVAWPAKLEHFSFAECVGEDSRTWSLSTIASVISTHKTTLRSLTIGEVQERGLINFDLTDFESLEYLSLSAWATGFDTGYEMNLLAPRLAKFRWSFATRREDIIDFDDEQENWLRRFAAAAVARKLTLQEIFIQFYLRSFCGQRVSFNERYPWDRMKHIARDIQGHGINLSWADPNMSREFWVDFCGPLTDEELRRSDT
ncbi:uncharacterized protein Triagg1_6092 [Trichoderma aggressivum f. europaeum]|uniref:Uncharacterized protein n=1 Tax=Trichoderma aggressivum f. europaeum TaxID=173218 RepID=A0AAE1IC40_9HYPO|nr:hypothetical protein Triagg1_6092 [Trichoderma aggressivum f. europaeum]